MTDEKVQKIAELSRKSMQKRGESCQQAIAAALDKYNCKFDVEVTFNQSGHQFKIAVEPLDDKPLQ